MKFDMKPQDKAFLKLAEKVASGKGSGKDRAELESLMKENPELGEEFAELQRNLRDEEVAEFWAVAVRVMAGTASAEERRQIESLRTADPERWEKYQDAVEFLDAMASRHDSRRSRKLEPMPPHIRKELLSHLNPRRTKGK